MRIANEILMFLRSSKNLKSEVSLHESVGTDKEGNEITLLDLLGSTGDEISEEIEQAEEKSHLLKKMAVLTSKEKYVLKLRYGLGNSIARTQREIAAALGISRSYVSRIEKKAIKKLLKEMLQQNKTRPK